MALVAYSDSESEHEDVERPETPPAKKRKLSTSQAEALPPLPSSFLDQYSSTVRTSTKDDPSLHGGRKRITPHVEGHWPTHVYLEWHPTSQEQSLLADIISASQPTSPPPQGKSTTKSLLANDLDVAQPLHISLSRPLTLKTNEKDAYLSDLKDALSETGVRTFVIQCRDLIWHSNESRTRWFLVIRVEESEHLSKLLVLSNETARTYKQLLLYAEHEGAPKNQFHISIAWSLNPRGEETTAGSAVERTTHVEDVAGVPSALLSRLALMSVRFEEVKVRIGQDVHSIRLKAQRQSTG